MRVKESIHAVLNASLFAPLELSAPKLRANTFLETPTVKSIPESATYRRVDE